MPLRPIGVGELLEGALGLIRSNPRTVLGLAAVISAASALVQMVGVLAALRFMDQSEILNAPNPEDIDLEEALSALTSMVGTTLVPSLIAGFLQLLASGLFIVLVGGAVLGRKLDAPQTWANLRPHLLSLVALAVLLGAGGLLCVLAIGAAIVITVGALGGWAVIPVLILSLGGACALVYAYVRLSMSSPALVMEGLSPLEALRRSWHLVGGSWSRVFGILILSAIITNLLSAVVTVPISTIAGLGSGFSSSEVPTIVATGIATMLSGLITLPFGAAITGLLYTDLRIRHEGLAPALISASMGPAAGQVPGWPAGQADDPLAPYRRPQHPYPPAV
ncbi:MAG: hypothetical protein WCF04_05985 [Candidatus Nanopelagicales bacterium]